MNKLLFLTFLPSFLLAIVEVSTNYFAGEINTIELSFQNGGWTTEEKDKVQQKSKCNIERHDAQELTQKEFLKR